VCLLIYSSAVIAREIGAGKSTYIKQVALLTVLAHIGSHVPAEHFSSPPIDRIYTRSSTQDVSLSCSQYHRVSSDLSIFVLVDIITNMIVASQRRTWQITSQDS
jgi:hypothetical protein